MEGSPLMLLQQSLVSVAFEYEYDVHFLIILVANSNISLNYKKNSEKQHHALTLTQIILYCVMIQGMIMGDRTIREIEDDMDYHMEQGNEGAVSELTEEIENMRDRLTKAISEGNLTDVLYFESLGFDLSEPFS